MAYKLAKNIPVRPSDGNYGDSYIFGGARDFPIIYNDNPYTILTLNFIPGTLVRKNIRKS